jgi:hypothetical protein
VYPGRSFLHNGNLFKDFMQKDCATEYGRRHLNKTVVTQGPHKKKKKLKTGSMAIGANSSLVVVGKRGWQMIEPWKLLLRGPPNQI